jgi:hypothetical protein
MSTRRLQLAAPRGGEIAGSMARSLGTGTLVAGAGALLAFSYMLSRPRGWATARPRHVAKTPTAPY